MTKILAFAGSNSPISINRQLVLNVSRRITEYPVDFFELRTLTIPIYDVMTEKEGFPEDVNFFYEKLQEYPALIISVNEHNRNVSAFFKNIIDWLSRKDRQFLKGKKILLMSTSPGRRGGASSLAYCREQFIKFGGEVVESFSLPQFYDNYSSKDDQLVNEVFEMGVMEVITTFTQEISQ